MKAVITVTGKDTMGIIAKVAAGCAEYGANIIDITLILPICSMISGGSLPVSAQTLALDLPVCLGIAAVALIPALICGKFHRWQGALCLIAYGAYLAVICF